MSKLSKVKQYVKGEWKETPKKELLSSRANINRLV